jgi:hypothetical protein
MRIEYRKSNELQFKTKKEENFEKIEQLARAYC